MASNVFMASTRDRRIYDTKPPFTYIVSEANFFGISELASNLKQEKGRNTFPLQTFSSQPRSFDKFYQRCNFFKL